MKNLSLFAALMFLLNVNIFAGPVEQKTAKQVAKNWLKQTALFQRQVPQKIL